MIPCLFTMSLCALSQAANPHARQWTDLLSTEERVQIMHLSNGVKTYVQEHDTPAHCGSFRVVIRKPSAEEELYRYDGMIESWDSVEQFFNHCQEKISINSMEAMHSLADFNFTGSDLSTLNMVPPQEIAVVAVGDFSAADMQSLIAKHFDSLDLRHQPFAAEDPIQMGIDPNMSIQSYADLKDAWKVLLLQDLYLASRSASPDDALLASYFADQFLLGDRCLSFQSFVDASVQLIEEMNIQDLFPYIHRMIQNLESGNVGASDLQQAQLFAKQGMCKHMSDAASCKDEDASLKHDVYIPPFHIEKNRSIIKRTALAKPEEFQLAKNLIIPITTETTASFYQLPITEKEKRLIYSIITTIAEKNILQLAFIKRSVEKKGRKIEHVHPMRFMGYILSHSELRSCLRTIKKSSFKWDAFISGFSRRMKEELANDNVYIHIPGFCQQIGGNQEVVTQLIHKRDWEGLVEEYL